MVVKASEIISNNIMNIMKQNGKKQIDLADYLGVSKQVISKMLTSGRMINAIELQKIANLICFYAHTRENAEKMMKPWEA